MRILIIARNVWDDQNGYTSTLTNIFESFQSDELAHLYIETQVPKTKCCGEFFQISEVALIKRIFNSNVKTGYYFTTGDGIACSSDNINKEKKILSFARQHRSYILPLFRELLWLFNGWKSSDLKNFLDEFNPDVIWFDGSPLPLMNRLFLYVKRYTQKPATMFIQDDIYSYQTCKGLISRLYKYILRKQVKKAVNCCQQIFTICPKMKNEYDIEFGINSIVLTKGIPSLPFKTNDIHSPLRMIYMGQTFYGRIYSLIRIAECLKEINKQQIIIVLDIYTSTITPEEQGKYFENNPFVCVHTPVPYDQVGEKMRESDILLFVESFDKNYSNVARLSFSTKITDYMAAGKCIFAIGPENIAPIEYLKENDIAIVCTEVDSIVNGMKILTDTNVVTEYAKKAFDFGQKYHSKKIMENRVHSIIDSL